MASPARKPLPLHESDLTTYARIRNAALEGFADRGLAATSIRDVAGAAGVSPGLVQHHFSTKAGLRDAVNAYVIAIAQEAFGRLAESDPPDDAFASLADRITVFVRENATAVRYVARALVDRDEEARKIFDAFVEITLANLRQLTDSGVARPDVDLDWAALHVVIFNLATILFEAAIDRHLPAPLFTPDQLERWKGATTDLYRRGLSTAPKSRGRSRP